MTPAPNDLPPMNPPAAAQRAPLLRWPLGREQIDGVIRGSWNSALGLLYALLVALPFIGHVPNLVLLLWALATVGVRVMRLWVGRRWSAQVQGARQLLAWSRWLMATATLQALVWGMGSWWLVAPEEPVAEAALHLGLAIVVLSNVQHKALPYPVLQLYTLGVTVPLVLRNLWLGDMHLLLAAISALFAAYALFSCHREALVAHDAMLQKARNAELIAQLKHEVQARTQAQLRAERAHADKAEFLAAAGHDLRQPLNAIGLLAQALPREPTAGEVSLAAGRIYDCVQQMGDIVHGLLDLSRLDAGTVVPVATRFDAAPLLAELGAQYADAARAKGLRLEVQVQTPAGGLPVHTDAGLLRRVLANLVANAVRYTPRGEVRLLARRDGDVVELCVADTGVGIAADELEQVFKPFYQAQNPGRDHRQGHGLGLAIVQRLTRLLNIELALLSTPGQGTRAELRLPLADAALPPVGADVGPDATPTPGSPHDVLQGRRVLVLEDDPASAQALALLLSGWGCEVRCASTTGGALAQVRSGWQPELVVADLRLAGGDDGYKSTLAVRQAMGISVPAVMMTGEGGQPLALQARQAGFTVLNKPLRAVQLRAVMNESFAAR